MSTIGQNVGVILPAAGSGKRFGRSENKLFTQLAGAPIWLHAAKRLVAHPRVARLVMPVSAEDRSRFESEFSHQIDDLRIELVAGGAARTDSVRQGLNVLVMDPSIELIAIHDAARPLLRSDDLDHVFAKADETGAAILATPVTATVKQTLDSGTSCQTIDRSTLYLAQTPQVFRCDVLKKAYEKHRGRPATDDAELVQRIGINVALVQGSPDNLKITHANDLAIAEAILQSQN